MTTRPSTFLCLHGNCSSSNVFQPLKDANTGCKIIAHDFPGHGGHKSSNPETDYAIPALREFVLQKAREIEGDYYLLGNSLGGHLAMDLIPRLTNCKALIICGAPPVRKPLNAEEAFLPWPSAAIGMVAESTQEEVNTAASEIATNSEATELFKQDYYLTDPLFRKCLGESLFGGDLEDEATHVTDASIPVFIIHGLEDPAVNLDYIKSLDGIAEIFEIHDCGHYPTLEQPQRVIEIAQEIMKEIG